MRIVSTISVIVLVTSICFSGELSEKEKTNAAVTAANEWLTVVDTGEYAKSWEMAGSIFQKQINAEKWADALGKSRVPLGKMVARNQKKANYTTDLPGVPDGEYVVVIFSSSFEKKKKALETVTASFENEVWKIVGYYIK